MTSIGEQVIANFLSYGVAITIFWFLAKKYFGNFEDRIKKNEEKSDKLETRAKEIEHNYIDRFEAVHKTINEKGDQMLRKVEEINTDKINFRMKQVEKMATIENKVDNLTNEIRRNNKP